MERYRVLITDLTEFGNLRCVAGWDLDRNTMVRPEPGPGQFWPAHATGSNQPFFPGNVVVFDATIPNPKTDYPHLNEDRVVGGPVKLEQTLKQDDFKKTLAEIGTSAEAIFGRNLSVANGKVYVKTGTNCASLGGVNVKRSDIRFYVQSYNSKRRPRLVVKTVGLTTDLSITATDLREKFRLEGIGAIDKHFDKSGDLHLRLGLARGFNQFPDRCYMQVNGIYRL